MRSVRSARMAVAAVATVSLLALSACSGDSESDEEPRADESSASSEEPTEDAPAETEEPTESADAGPAGAEGQPAWARPVTTGGELISTVEVGDVTVEVYQVSTTKATEDGNFADPDTNKPLLAKGDDIVFVNYVVTNNGEAIDLGASLVNIDARYDDWQWLQGMDGVTDAALFEAQGVNDDVFAEGSYVDPSIYTFGPGEQYSYGENFKYQAGSPITFEASVTPVDAEGELLHDQNVEGEGTGTIS